MPGRLWAAINASAGARFADLQCTQIGQSGFEFLPDPGGEIFAGWIFQSGDLIKVVVVELVINGCECRFDVGKVHHPAAMFVYSAIGKNLHIEGVAVQARTFMPFGNIGESVSGLETEFFEDFHGLILAR